MMYYFSSVMILSFHSSVSGDLLTTPTNDQTTPTASQQTGENFDSAIKMAEAVLSEQLIQTSAQCENIDLSMRIIRIYVACRFCCFLAALYICSAKKA